MAVQIYTIRSYIDSFTNTEKHARLPFKKEDGTTASGGSVEALFAKIKPFIKTIPKKERYNLHYSIASYANDDLTGFINQTVLPIDLDGIDLEKQEIYIRTIEEVTGVKRQEMGVVSSGHGLHFILGLGEPITDESYFKNNISKYKMLCGEISHRLYAKGLAAIVDSGPFRNKATLRLPATVNRKIGMPDAECVLLYGNILPKTKNLDALIDSDVAVGEAPDSLKQYPTPDRQAVEDGCLFLKWAKANQNLVKEPQWYALLTILSKLDDSLEICHEYSREHAGYSEASTQEKSEYAKEIGPRTCASIDGIWDGCSGCEHHGSCPSPIVLKGVDYIGTENVGFHHITTDKNGNTKHIPDYEGLRRFFNKKHAYIVTDAKICYVWRGSHWEHLPDIYIEAFAQDHFKPDANNTKINEFKSLVLRTQVKSEDWFGRSTAGKMNFDNGILTLDTMEFQGHDKSTGFRSTLPYKYDPSAECPTFDRFMDNITENDDELKNVLMEFAGYAFSGVRCKFDKALILNGHGANGKSTFIRVMTAAAGKDAYSSLTLPEMQKEQDRQMMVGKLFNIAEEAPSRQGLDSATFKNLVSGGEMTVKVVYKAPYRAANIAKLIIACNELPNIDDVSHGMFRRLIIVPFNACFTGKEDFNIIEKMLLELPGVFNKIITGYHSLIERNRFGESAKITDAIDTFKLYSDTVDRWFSENIKWQEPKQDQKVEAMSRITMNDVYQKYVFASEVNKEKPEPFKRFVYKVSRLIPDRRKIKRRPSDGGHARVMIHGMLFNTENTSYNKEF